MRILFNKNKKIEELFLSHGQDSGMADKFQALLKDPKMAVYMVFFILAYLS